MTQASRSSASFEARKRHRLGVALIVAFLTPTIASADLCPIGNEFQVTNSGYSGAAAVAADTQGRESAVGV